MKNIFIILLFLNIINTQAVLAQPPLQLVTMNFKPYIWCDEGSIKGIAADIIAELFQQSDLSYSIKCYPWKRALLMVKEGTADGIILGYKTPEREAFGLFLDNPIQFSQYSVFVRKNHQFPFEEIKDLYGKKIGIDREHTISPEFDKAVNNGDITVEEASTTEHNLHKLLAGRFDAYVNNHHVTLYMVKQLGLSEHIAPLIHPVMKPSPTYLWFSLAADIPNKEALIQQLNQVLNKMWIDGTVQRITNSYIQ